MICLNNRQYIKGVVYVRASATKFRVKLVRSSNAKGEHLVKKFAVAGVYRWFCGECGSPLISSRDAQPELYRLRIGTLDTPLQQKPSMHIFAASKAEWDCITDDLPQYTERP